MISRELLNKVLNDEVGDYFYYKDNLLWFEQDDKEYNINIYELAYKCKEWALSKGYILSSNNYNNGGCCQVIQENSEDCPECGESSTFKYIHSFTEIEAVIKACEGLMEEIK